MILKYFSVFLAILLFGSIADVPVMFLGVQGTISLYFVSIAGFLTDIFSDLFWYWLGSKIGIERFTKLKFFRQKPERMNKVGHALDKYGMLMLYGSKFIYSFGIPTQIVAGAHHYPKKKFLLANILGAASTLVVLFVLAKIFNRVDIVENYVNDANTDLLFFVLIVIGIHFLVSKPLQKFFNR